MHSLTAVAAVLLCHWAPADAAHMPGRNLEKMRIPALATAQPDEGHRAQAVVPVGPAPTRGPDLTTVELELAKRQARGETCGYVDGKAASPLWCASAGRCVANGLVSNMFCCPNTIALSSCVPDRVCIDSSQWRTITTLIPADTVYCSSADFPSCVTYVFSDAPYSGFKIYRCGTSYNLGVAFQSITTTSTSTTSSSSRTTSTTSTRSTSTTSSSSSSSSASDGPAPVPVGAIAGGVVGGIAVISLVVVGLFFLLRKKRVPEYGGPPISPPAPQPAVQQIFSPPHSPPGYPPPVAYQQSPIYDHNRGSVLKPPSEGTSRMSLLSNTGLPSPGLSSAGMSSPGSPSPHLQHGFASREPEQSYYQQGLAASPGPGQSHPQQGFASRGPEHFGQGHQTAHELPSVRGDRELRELQG